MPKPPEAVTGVNGVAAVPTVSVVVGTAWVVVSAGALTVREKVFDEVCAVGVVWSVTVTVKVVAASRARRRTRDLAGRGREAQARRQGAAGQRVAQRARAAGAVTGVNGVAAAPAVNVVEDTACVVVSSGFTVNCADVPALPAEALVALGVPAGMVKGEPVELAADIATWNVQVVDALIEPPDSDRLVALATGEKVAPQVFDAFGVAATTTPVGSVIESATPEIDDVFGLVSVTVMVEVPPATIEGGLSAVADVGAAGPPRARLVIEIAIAVSVVPKVTSPCEFS